MTAIIHLASSSDEWANHALQRTRHGVGVAIVASRVPGR